MLELKVLEIAENYKNDKYNYERKIEVILK